jgi:hypothetical protein
MSTFSGGTNIKMHKVQSFEILRRTIPTVGVSNICSYPVVTPSYGLIDSFIGISFNSFFNYFSEMFVLTVIMRCYVFLFWKHPYRTLMFDFWITVESYNAPALVRLFWRLTSLPTSTGWKSTTTNPYSGHQKQFWFPCQVSCSCLLTNLQAMLSRHSHSIQIKCIL